MKNYILLLFALTFIFSCGPYQKALKSDDAALKYQMADSLYTIGKYSKALKLMEDIIPAYRGKPQAERLMFFYADTYFHLEDFYLSGYQFERFARSYPLSDKVEEAAFKGAKSYYELSPRYSLDQKDTYIALEKLQTYINTYPDSDLIPEANKLVLELNTKLQKKDFEIAKQYFHVEDYKSAIEAFENFIVDHPGSIYRSEAFLMRLKAAYNLAIKSFDVLVEERLENAKKFYNSFNKYYTDSEFKEEADSIFADIEKELEKKQS